MFKNKWRRYSFYILLVSIPCALIGGLILKGYEPVSNILLVAGIGGSIIGFLTLKFAER